MFSDTQPHVVTKHGNPQPSSSTWIETLLLTNVANYFWRRWALSGNSCSPRSAPAQRPPPGTVRRTGGGGPCHLVHQRQQWCMIVPPRGRSLVPIMVQLSDGRESPSPSHNAPGTDCPRLGGIKLFCHGSGDQKSHTEVSRGGSTPKAQGSVCSRLLY